MIFNKKYKPGSAKETIQTWLYTLGICAAIFIVLLPIVKFYKISAIENKWDDIGRLRHTITKLKNEAHEIQKRHERIPQEVTERIKELSALEAEWEDKRKQKKQGKYIPFTQKQMIKKQQGLNKEIRALRNNIWQSALEKPYTPRLVEIAAELNTAEAKLTKSEGHILASLPLLIIYKLFHWVLFTIWGLSGFVFVFMATIGAIGVFSGHYDE